MERDYPRPERIRALIAEVDRLCREAEHVMDHADQTMKRGAFWPERRKTVRPNAWDHPDDDGGNAA
jgi:hypothetical protein